MGRALNALLDGSAHRCPRRDCGRMVSADRLVCSRCWSMVPGRLKQPYWDAADPDERDRAAVAIFKYLNDPDLATPKRKARSKGRLPRIRNLAPWARRHFLRMAKVEEAELEKDAELARTPFVLPMGAQWIRGRHGKPVYGSGGRGPKHLHASRTP